VAGVGLALQIVEARRQSETIFEQTQHVDVRSDHHNPCRLFDISTIELTGLVSQCYRQRRTRNGLRETSADRLRIY